MDKYFDSYREMISLRGLTDHTLKSYSTYIRSYLDYLQNILHKQPEDVSWQELRDFINWLQADRGLLTVLSILPFHSSVSFTCMSFINPGIILNSLSGGLMLISLLSLLRKTLSLLSIRYRISNRKPWSLSCILPVCVLVNSVILNMKILTVKRCGCMLHTAKIALIATLSFLLLL